MKKIYLFTAAATLFCWSVNAQTLSSTGCNPTVGETFTTFTTAYFSPGNSGQGQIWDFSTISGTSATSNIVTVGSTPNGSSFPNANIAVDYGGNYGYQKTSSAALQVFGYDAGGTIISYSNPEDFLHYPFSYSNSYTDAFLATFTSGGYNFTREGNTTVTADGTGTLITPSGTFTNVMRVHFVQDYTDSTDIGGTPYIITYYNDEYLWYKDGIHSVLAATYSFTNSASGTQTSGLYLSASVGIEENSALENSFELFPNPASQNVKINFDVENFNSASINIVNITGQLVYAEELTEITAGKNTHLINLESFEKGVYFISIQVDGAIVTRKLVIE